MLDDQLAGRDHCGDFRVPEVAKQGPDVAINRLRPQFLSRLEVATDAGGIDARVACGGVEGNETALIETDHPDRAFLPISPFLHVLEPIDHRQHSLDFVTNHVAAHLKRLTIDPFAMRLIGPAIETLVAGVLVTAGNQGGNDDLHSGLRQPAGILVFERDARSKTDKLFGV